MPSPNGDQILSREFRPRNLVRAVHHRRSSQFFLEHSRCWRNAPAWDGRQAVLQHLGRSITGSGCACGGASGLRARTSLENKWTLLFFAVVNRKSESDNTSCVLQVLHYTPNAATDNVHTDKSPKINRAATRKKIPREEHGVGRIYCLLHVYCLVRGIDLMFRAVAAPKPNRSTKQQNMYVFTEVPVYTAVQGINVQQ